MASLSREQAITATAAECDVESTDILGVAINAINMQTAIATIENWIERQEKHYVCICTVHTIVECQRDPRFKEIVNGAGLRTPDGMPLVWLQRWARKNNVSRVCGPDLLPALCARSERTGHRHFFYGGALGVAEELAAELSAKHPGLHVVGVYTPPMLALGEIEAKEVIDTINDARPDIVWVGLGTPKQDFWIANHRPLLCAPALIAVGAAFDFHSGRIRRAPKWMQRSGIEWLFRLSQDPKRLMRRYTIDNVRFVSMVIRRKFWGTDQVHRTLT